MHADTATRQHWMSVLAHSQPAELAARLNALNITADYEVIRTAETGLVQIQARMGGTGERFFAGDATLTRAAVRLTDGTLGYSWVLGRDKQHAERCALIDALMQQSRHFQNLSETLIAPLDADRMARIAARQAEVNASRVDFFTITGRQPERRTHVASHRRGHCRRTNDRSAAARVHSARTHRAPAPVPARHRPNPDLRRAPAGYPANHSCGGVLMYVAVKGGEKAIDAAHALQESRRRGDTDLPELSVAQIEQQLNLAVDRVMTEGGIADRELAALALKQASGDNVEAIFLLRAYRTTLTKLAVSEPLDTTEMRLERRISAVYKDIPGGQLLGPTYDYTHRLLDFTLLANGEAPTLTTADSEQQPSPHVFSLLARQGLAKFEEDSGAQPDDITRTPPVYPCSRSSRLQQLMRGDEGYLLALAYSTQRGYGRNHPFAGEIRSGYIDVSIVPEELGFAVNVGELLMTECEMVNGFIDPPDEPPHFTRGYGLVFGMSERKAMAMALVDRALQAPEYGEHATGPAQDEEFVLAHADNVEAAGFVSHLKLPHYVDFQAELELLKRLQQEQNHG